MPASSTLYVVTPPAVEPISLAVAKQHLRMDQDYDDLLIGGMLSAARLWAEDYLGRCLVTQQLLWVVSERPYAGAYPFISLPFPVTVYPLWYPWPELQHQPMELPRAPVQSVDTVSYGVWGEDDTDLDPSDWQADIPMGRLQITGGAVPMPHDHISVTFTVGYGADGTKVPKTIIAGILILLGFLYEHRGDDSMNEIPLAARMLLGTQRRTTFGG